MGSAHVYAEYWLQACGWTQTVLTVAAFLAGLCRRWYFPEGDNSFPLARQLHVDNGGNRGLCPTIHNWDLRQDSFQLNFLAVVASIGDNCNSLLLFLFFSAPALVGKMPTLVGNAPNSKRDSVLSLADEDLEQQQRRTPNSSSNQSSHANALALSWMW